MDSLEHQAESAVRLAAMMLGRKLLAAGNEQELADLLDELVERPDYLCLAVMCVETAYEAGWQDAEIAGAEVVAPLRAVLTAQAADRLRRAAALVQAIGRGFVRVMETKPEAFRDFVPDDPAESLAEALTDPRVHPTVGLKSLASHKGNLCLWGMLAAGDAGQLLTDWMSEELSRRWHEGVTAGAELIASIPEAGIPEALVPRDKRLKLPELRREAAAAQRGTEMMVMLRAHLGAAAWAEDEGDWDE